MKKTLIALALIAMSGASFAQTSTCNGTGACSPPANTQTVGDNRGGQIAAGGSIANGAAVTANGGVVRGSGNSTNTNTTGASTSTATGGSATGGSVGNTSSTSSTGASTATVGNLSTGASTSSSGGNTQVGGSNTATNGGNTLTGGAVSVNIADNSSTVEAARVAGDSAVAAARELSDIKIRNTPSVSAAALTSSNDTCMGSVSVGGSGPGIGLSIGSTYKDDNCVMLKNSRELWNMGMKAASLALMCTDKANKEALELTGFVCPQTAREQQRATANATAPSPQYTDPIVRARMGLPPLK